MMKRYDYKNVILTEISSPLCDNDRTPVLLSDETIEERKNKVIALMKRENLDSIVVYADVEHGSNFEYLTGFIPRFEEALLVLHKDESAYLILGNENLNKVKYARIDSKPIHAPYFSLPNQPMENKVNLTEIIRSSGIKENSRIGIVGWKYFTSSFEDNRKLFDVPYFIVKAIMDIVKNNELVENRSDIFINADYGVRATNNANEIAHYEYGSSLASDCVLNALNAIEIGKTEIELGDLMKAQGQHNNVVTICATGDRFVKANLYPTDKVVRLGDKISLTTGYKGGLSSRSGYAVSKVEELPEGSEDYIEALAAPYFMALVAWLENIHIGMSGKEMYELIETVLPKKDFNWSLNPGHLTSDEEWLSSPIYPESKELLKSGMLLQTDIIPSKPGYGGAGCENGIVLADEKLRNEIKSYYPELWSRFEKRKAYIKSTLNINLSDDVLPLSSTVAYYRPLMLNKKLAFIYNR
ncbi:MAG: Xaa-Pro aminopeptidase [Clostridiales bacterium]|nr:Xaa-Pro aminopeptidase [Clostridiales bacterium]